MRIQTKRLVGAAVALAATSMGLAISGGSAQALPPGTLPHGPLEVLSTTGNTSSDSLTVQVDEFPDNGTLEVGRCPGPSTTGHFLSSFFVPLDRDPASVFYDSLGPIPDPAWDGDETAILSGPLYLSGGVPFMNINVATEPAGLITSTPVTFSWDWSDTTYRPAAGSYHIGLACTLVTDPVQGAETTKYWSTVITIVDTPGAGAAEFTWSLGLPEALPGAPTLNSVVAGAAEGEALVSFTGVTANPEVDEYIASFDDGVNPPLEFSNDSSPIPADSLTVGTTYTVTVRANNAIGQSGPSNAISYTVPAELRAPVTGLTADPAGEGVVELSWTAPTGPAPTGYSVTVSPADVTIPDQPAGSTGVTVSGLTVGTTYTFTVTPLHPAPFAGTPASVSTTVLGDAVIVQDITVERPEGLLLFTQTCGVNSESPALPAGLWNGFINGLAGGAAAYDPSAPLLSDGTPDPNYPEYPYPIDEATGIPNPNYTTACGIELDQARLVTETNDPFRGVFFRTQGVIDKITVVDTRDDDTGWTLNGTAEEFVSGDQTFSGDYLGWLPAKSFDSGVDPISGYDQVVTPGDWIAPAVPLGLSDGETLGFALADEGLGIAELDARLVLLIPLSADAGEYTGKLTYTFV